MPKVMSRRPEPEIMDEPAGAKAYADADFSEVNQRFVDRLLKLVGTKRGATVLDLGTGPGDIPIRIARARPTWRITAVDYSAPMLRFARAAERRAHLAKPIRWVRADAKHTRLPSRSFDVILSNSILHHINEVDGFWREVKRMAKPGALILFRDLHRPANCAAARRVVRKYAAGGPKLMQRDYYNSLLASYTVGEVRKQLAKAGLRGLKVRMASNRHWDAFGRLPGK